MKTLQLTLILLLAGLTGLPHELGAQTVPHNFTFEPLPYAYDALEPYIDRLTVEIHYSRHHRAYYDNFIKAIQGTEMEKMSFGEIFGNISKHPVAVRNNGGGYYNHNLYFSHLSPNGAHAPSGNLEKQILKDFGSFEALKDALSKAASTRFGSGWAFLSVKKDGSLSVSSTPNQDNPLMDKNGLVPILGLDVWEHAYYLKYQNRRPDYIAAFWNVVNWGEVAKLYAAAKR